MADDESMWALKNGSVEDVEKKLTTKEDVNKMLEVGRMPLHVAADFGQVEVMNYLISKGADVNAQDKHGITPLLAAIYEGHFSCVKILLEQGADKTHRGPDGKNAFEAAETTELKNLLK